MAAKVSRKRASNNDRAPKLGMVRVATASFAKADDPEKARASADLMLRPSSAAGAVAVEYLKPTFGEQDLRALVDSLEAQTAKLRGNDLSDCEAMLFGQAQALQSIFVALARRATKQQYLNQWEAYIRVALKAQNQCRMTLETLATVRNPPVVYAKQANIANVPQQVNNGLAHAGTAETTPTKLAGIHELLPNTENTSLTSRPYRGLEALGTVDGAEDTRGQGKGGNERLQRRGEADAS